MEIPACDLVATDGLIYDVISRLEHLPSDLSGQDSATAPLAAALLAAACLAVPILICRHRAYEWNFLLARGGSNSQPKKAALHLDCKFTNLSR